jgi:hypothetical protein
MAEAEKAKCKECGGKGWNAKMVRGIHGLEQHNVCSACGGKGTIPCHPKAANESRKMRNLINQLCEDNTQWGDHGPESISQPGHIENTISEVLQLNVEGLEELFTALAADIGENVDELDNFDARQLVIHLRACAEIMRNATGA